jgi:phosphoenolpyruvate phosphomutase
MVRAGISAMQQVAQEIATDCGVRGVESGIAKVEEVFRLQNEKELRNAEKTYLPNA